jgi:hypothetical protein
VFRLFPIDTERYDLCSSLDKFFGDYVNDRAKDRPVSEDERVQEFFSQTYSLFRTAAISYVHVERDEAPEGQSQLRVDRWKRVKASSVNYYPPELILDEDAFEQNVDSVIAFLWVELQSRLGELHGH